jgi:hypothetical protein
MDREEAIARMVELSSNLPRYGSRASVLISRLAGRAETLLLEGGGPVDQATLLADRLLDRPGR